MANSRYDYLKKREEVTDDRFYPDTYIIVRIDGDKFHKFCSEHNFHKPNDKRGLDLMVDSAKHLIRTYRKHIPLAYGHSDEFSFLIKANSDLLSRRKQKINSILPVIFATYYNSNWDRFFGNPALGEVTPRKYDAWFDAKYFEFPNCNSVIDYFRWRQIDCHINNLYNTTLSALAGRYVKYEFFEGQMTRKPITSWVTDPTDFLSTKDATDRLTGTVSADKHDILFKKYGINYNNELEQFKKGTIIVDNTEIVHTSTDIIKTSTFWDSNKIIFDDYVTCPAVK